MKILYLSTLAFFFLLTSAYAQPTFNMNDISYQIGDVFVGDSLDYIDMSAMIGPDMVWNLDEVALSNEVVTIEMLSIDDVDSSIDFEGATIARKHTFEGGAFYQYFSQEGNNIQYHGNFFDGVNSSSVYDNTQLVYNAPLTYGSSDSDTFSATNNTLGYEAQHSGVIDYEVQGYGSLLFDGISFSDVLLMHVVKIDTTVLTISGLEFETFDTEDTYLFLKAGHQLPILSFSHLTSTGGLTGDSESFTGTVILQTSVGIEEFSSVEFSIFPNPIINNEVSLKFEEPLTSDIRISLIDAIGREHEINVLSRIQDVNFIQIRLPNNLSSGIYQIVISGENIFTSKQIVVE